MLPATQISYINTIPSFWSLNHADQIQVLKKLRRLFFNSYLHLCGSIEEREQWNRLVSKGPEGNRSVFLRLPLLIPRPYSILSGSAALTPSFGDIDRSKGDTDPVSFL
jgi:hypothetical protein